MSYRENALIIKTSCLAEGIYEMWLKTDKMAGEAVPGQFISVYSNDGARLLPRPISICRIDKDNLRIVYRVAGKGTEEFSKMKEGEYVNIQGPLGNGYDIKSIMEYVKNVTGNDCADTELKAILFGGGIGVPPMLELAKQLECKKQAVLGYRNSRRSGYCKQRQRSAGTKGNVLDAVRENNLTADVIFACGPTPMLRAIKEYAVSNNIACFVSLEEKMACGIGACLACVCQSTDIDDHSKVKNKRVCKEGPVFNVKEVEL